MKRILFVEDDPVVIAVYRNRLEREGFNIEVAEDGLVAMRSLATTKPDLVVLDLMLPKVNGLEILKYIRGNSRLGAVPVIVLSNAYLPDMVKQAMLAGANKPMFKSQCTPVSLLKVVRSFLPDAGGNGEDDAQGTAVGSTGTVSGKAEDGLDLNLMLRARAEFLESAPAEMTHIRELCVAYIKNSSSPTGLTLLENLYQRVHFISARAGLIGLSRLAMLAGAFEAVLFEIVLRPASATKSLFHTIAQATDCLRRLIDHADSDSVDGVLESKVIVVDDDGVCNHIMVQALRRVNLKAVGVKDPIDAIRLLENDKFDLVLLDIMMPGMDGFDVCKQLRSSHHHRTTPVIFVTANAEFENRVKSILSGGNELIAKPISPMELALKAITILLDSKIAKPEEAQPAAAAAVQLPRQQRQVSPLTKLQPKIETEPLQVESPEQMAEPVPMAAAQDAVVGEQVEPVGPTFENAQADESVQAIEPAGEHLASPEELIAEPIAEVEPEVALTNVDVETAPQEILTDEKAGAELMARLGAPETLQPPPPAIEEMLSVPVEEPKPVEHLTDAPGWDVPVAETPAQTSEMPAQLVEEFVETQEASEELRKKPTAESEAPTEVAASAVSEPAAETTIEEQGIEFEKPVTAADLLQPAPGPLPLESIASEPVGREQLAPESVTAQPVAQKPVELSPVAARSVEATSETEPVKAQTDAAKPDTIKPVVTGPVVSEQIALEPVAPEPVAVGAGEPTIISEPVVVPDVEQEFPLPEPMAFQDMEKLLEEARLEIATEETVQVEPLPPMHVEEIAFPKLESDESERLQALIAEMNLTVNTSTMPMQKEQAQVMDKIAIAVARIIYGDEKLTELNVRLVRIALERYNIPELLGLAEK